MAAAIVDPAWAPRGRFPWLTDHEGAFLYLIVQRHCDDLDYNAPSAGHYEPGRKAMTQAAGFTISRGTADGLCQGEW